MGRGVGVAVVGSGVGLEIVGEKLGSEEGRGDSFEDG